MCNGGNRGFFKQRHLATQAGEEEGLKKLGRPVKFKVRRRGEGLSTGVQSTEGFPVGRFALEILRQKSLYEKRDSRIHCNTEIGVKRGKN